MTQAVLVRMVLLGQKGDTGSTGLQGVKGDTGSTGLTGAKGDVGITWRGAWNALISYAVRDVVLYTDSVCSCAHRSKKWYNAC